jgi:hypothetical protein
VEKRPQSQLVPVGEVLETSLEGGFLSLAREMVRVFEVWDQAVGPFNAARTRPDSMKNGRLTVMVESAVWIDRFSYFKAEFTSKLNEALGGPLVREILFRVGPVGRTPSYSGEKPADSPAETPSGPLPATPELEQAVSAVRDPELRAHLARFLARQKSGD